MFEPVTNFTLLFQAKSEESLVQEKQWLDAEKIWLMHRGGFAAARKESGPNSDPGKIRIRLEQTGDLLSVDEDDIEKVISSWCKVFKV